ncbi:MAG TPA: tetratricopeptide repeat protein [bacterium]|jgi:tetratricopeptide (TPR) repeat protein|nr:tetratricopeptide repeat protein [bacterium]
MLRPRLIFLAAFLACAPFAGAAPAAPLSPQTLDGPGQEAEAAHTEAEYRAAYFYSVACLAGQKGDVADQAALLQRAQEGDPDSALLTRERGEAQVQLGNKAAAAELLKKALQARPGDAGLRAELGRLYQDMGRAADARALFLKPDGSDPSDAESLRSLIGLDFVQKDYSSALRRLQVLLASGGSADDRELMALTLQHLGRFKEASAGYRAVLALDAKRTATWGRLADCDQAAGDTPTASADLKAGLAANPDSPLLADELGRLLYSAQDYAGAEKAFDRLVDMDPGDAHSLLYRGLARLKTGYYRKAEADFKAVGRLEKDDPDQAYALALSLLLQKKYSQAQPQFERVLKLDPQAEDAWADLAFLQEKSKQQEQAEATLKKGLKAMPDSQELALLLSGVQQDLKDLPAAEQTLRDALARGGGDEIRFQLAVILDKRGDFADVEKELGTLIAESPRHAEALNYLGYSWAERGEKLVQAEALIRRALAVDPGNRYYLDSLGWTLYKQGKVKDALEPLAVAAKEVVDSSDPDEAVVFDHLAAVQKKLGQARAARLSLKKAAKIRARAGL